MRRLLQLILLVRCAGEHSSSRSLLMPALEQCKLRRELEPHPEAKNNLLTNVLIHEHDLNVSLRMYIMPPLRVRLEAQNMDHDEVLTVHAKIFSKITYVDPAVPNASYPDLTPPCEQLWLPQPRPSEVPRIYGTLGRDAPTANHATLRVLGDHKTSSLWDERMFAFPQSKWTYVNFPYDAHVAVLRFKVNDANIQNCNDDDLRAHTLEEMADKHHFKNESDYLAALSPNGWTVGPLSQWRAWSHDKKSSYGADFDNEYCTIEIPLKRNPTPYVIKYYVFDVLFMVAGVASTNFGQISQLAPRYSAITICMLLMMTTVRRDLGYGFADYVTVINVQSFVSILVLILCLFQTLVLQRLQVGEADIEAKAKEAEEAKKEAEAKPFGGSEAKEAKAEAEKAKALATRRKELRTSVDRIGRQTLEGFAAACAIGFIVQLWILRPSAGDPSLPGGVYKELQTSAAAAHLWPWATFGLLWFVFNVGRIWLELHRKKLKEAAKSDTRIDPVISRSKTGHRSTV